MADGFFPSASSPAQHSDTCLSYSSFPICGTAAAKLRVGPSAAPVTMPPGEEQMAGRRLQEASTAALEESQARHLLFPEGQVAQFAAIVSLGVEDDEAEAPGAFREANLPFQTEDFFGGH